MVFHDRALVSPPQPPGDASPGELVEVAECGFGHAVPVIVAPAGQDRVDAVQHDRERRW